MAIISGNETAVDADGFEIFSGDPELIVELTGSVVSTIGGLASAIKVPTQATPFDATIIVRGLVASQNGPGIWYRDNGGTVTVEETGQVRSGGDNAIVGFSFSNTSLNLINHGLIVGDTFAFTSSAVADELLNTGTMWGRIGMRDGNDLVTNQGTIIGNVELGAGNDTFDARGGDVDGEVQGGIGSDTYIVSDQAVPIVELDGEGFDKVEAFADYTLGDNLEVLDLRGNADLVGTGNALDNTMTGNVGSNTLKGKAGDDFFVSSKGDDRLVGGAGMDGVSYQSVKKNVEVRLDQKLALAQGTDTLIKIENVFTGTGNDLLVGNGKDNLLFSGDGDDVLEGRGGVDTLFGDVGDDILTGGRGADQLFGGGDSDTFIFGDGDGADVVGDFDEDNNAEKIDLSGMTSITTFRDLKNNHLMQDGADAVIDAGGGDEIRLSNVMVDDLNKGDFIL